MKMTYYFSSKAIWKITIIENIMALLFYPEKLLRLILLP